MTASQSPESTRFCHFARSHQNNLAAFTSARLLEFEQKLLAFEPARVAGQLAVASDHAMARDDDAQRVAADGLADLLGRRAVGERGGEFPIGDGFAVGDGGQQLPDAVLRSSPRSEVGRSKSVRSAGQVIRQLSLRLGE